MEVCLILARVITVPRCHHKWCRLIHIEFIYYMVFRKYGIILNILCVLLKGGHKNENITSIFHCNKIPGDRSFSRRIKPNGKRKKWYMVGKNQIMAFLLLSWFYVGSHHTFCILDFMAAWTTSLKSAAFIPAHYVPCTIIFLNFS